MGMVAAFAGNVLKLLLNATALANVADNAASSPFTNIYVSLHTADPGSTGDQTTNETSYTSYVRQAVARTTGGWTVTSNVATPVANITFPISTGGTPTITHWAIGTAVSAAGIRWMNGTVTPNITVSTSVAQNLVNTSTITLS
jgi:hypothetical protein